MLSSFLDLDLTAIKFALTLKAEGPQWSVQRAEDAERDYKRFLFLNAKYPSQTMVPTRDIDDFWHMHILDTQKYVEDCQKLFGKYLHHFPYFGIAGEDDAQNFQIARLETDQLFLSEFGYQPCGIGKGALCNGSKDIGFDPKSEYDVSRAHVGELYVRHAACQGQITRY